MEVEHHRCRLEAGAAARIHSSGAVAMDEGEDPTGRSRETARFTRKEKR
jgi:hypothetical protein